MRDETFTIDEARRLVRSVAPKRGKPYAHTCTAETFSFVADLIDEAGDRGCTIEELADWGDLPHSQVATAMAFLKERGCVKTVNRRSYPATGDVSLDAMTEYHALREGA